MNCKIPGNMGTHIYGYQYVPGKDDGQGILVRNEQEAKWVAWMFERYGHDGWSIFRIVKELNTLAVPSKRGGRWRGGRVHYMLRNPAYLGEMRFFQTTKGEPKRPKASGPRRYRRSVPVPRPAEYVITVPVPAIVERELWEFVQRRLDENKLNAGRRSRTSPLPGRRVRCATCGGCTGLTQNGGRHSGMVYRCRHKNSAEFAKPCSGPQVSARRVEQALEAFASHVLAKPDLVKTALRYLKGQGIQGAESDDELR